MSTGLPAFDTTVQESNAWLKAIEDGLPPCDRQQAYAAFRAVSHVLRDRLPMDAVLGLSAQLPMLLRGVFLEGWRPVGSSLDVRTADEFAAEVERRFPPSFPRRANEAAEAVFRVMVERLDPGESRKLVQRLPGPLKALWPVVHAA